MTDTVWKFNTEHYTIALEIDPSFDLDLSWDDTGEVSEKLESGEYTAFDSRVVVYNNGCEIGSDSLGQSIYSDPSEFWTAHRDKNPMNRNCTIYRAKMGENHVICHYFPDMVRQAVKDARRNIVLAKQMSTERYAAMRDFDAEFLS